MQDTLDRDLQTGRFRAGNPGGPGRPRRPRRHPGRPRKFAPLKSRDTPWRAAPGRRPPTDAEREAAIRMAISARASRLTPVRRTIAAGWFAGPEHLGHRLELVAGLADAVEDPATTDEQVIEAARIFARMGRMNMIRQWAELALEASGRPD